MDDTMAVIRTSFSMPKRRWTRQLQVSKIHPINSHWRSHSFDILLTLNQLVACQWSSKSFTFLYILDGFSQGTQTNPYRDPSNRYTRRFQNAADTLCKSNYIGDLEIKKCLGKRPQCKPLEDLSRPYNKKLAFPRQLTMIIHDIGIRAPRVIEFNIGILQHSHTNFSLNFTSTNGMLVLLVTLLNNKAHDWVPTK